MKIAYWIDEYSRAEGFATYYDEEINNIDDAKKIAKNLIDIDNFAVVEVIENDKVLYGYDGVDEW
jgi:hypothetical protein